jgi:hypothetical protein
VSSSFFFLIIRLLGLAADERAGYIGSRLGLALAQSRYNIASFASAFLWYYYPYEKITRE